jgi:uncharacterized protein (DUF885 family)
MTVSETLQEADELLRDLYESEWRWRTEQLGEQSLSSRGRIDDFLPDVSEAAQQERLRYWESVLDKLGSIAFERLSAAAKQDYSVYEQQISTLIAQQQYRMYERPANADTSFWSVLAERGNRALDSEEDARRYVKQLADVPRYFAQNIDNMRAGIGRGFGPPQVSMRGRQETIRTVATARAPEETAFFNPFDTLPGALPQEIRERLREDGAAVIATAVIPAYRELLTFVEQEYFPQLPVTTAAADGPDGAAFYQAQLREFTTTELSPQEIFDIGQREVAAIRAEMEDVAAQVGFAGDVPGLLEFMRTDPRFYAKTAKELLMVAAYEAKKFDLVVDRFFGKLPEMRFGIVEVPADLAPFYTFGRGGLGRYTLNTYNLPARPLYSIPALTLHEAAPGHAFQIPFAHEQKHHPAFRRHVYISAYGEGWGLYAERLGVEMGIYETPFEMMGMLSFQMWRAVRLVVDPGMHALGWSREQAQDFMRANTAIADHEITTEIDRYIAWPGQACAYHLGQLKIWELRRRAEEALGEAFDIRNFHDAVLGLGSVPLTVLEQEIDRFIAEGGRSPFMSS